MPAAETVTWGSGQRRTDSAASPVMAPVLADLAETFNAQARAPDGKPQGDVTL